MAKANPVTRNKKKRAAALLQQGALAEAKPLYQQVCQADRRDLDAWVALGTIHGQLGEFEDSERCFSQAITIKPDSQEAHFNLAKVQRELGRYSDAEAHYRQALKLHPDWIQALNNLGNLLHAMERDEEAADCYRRAIAIEPNYLEARFNLANLDQARGEYTEAIAAYRELLAIQPDHPMLINNLASALAKTGQLDKALACYDQVLALTPEAYPAHAEAAYSKGLYKLLLGDYREGWTLHEWRWRTGQFKSCLRQFDRPQWLGDKPITCKTILLHAEQGLGDAIQFVRYVPLIEEQGANVILEVPASLVSLINTLKGSYKLVTKGGQLPPFDYHCPLMSLPLALKTTVETIPVDIPYLAADEQNQCEWRQRLGEKTKPRIGLVWSGNPKHLNDRNRSIPLRSLAPLLALDYEFHALQKDIRDDDRAFLDEATQIHSHEKELQDFSDTAALIANLDLVIAVDTSAVHLAGALGKPVWVLLPYVPDFRWLLDRSDSPWYPSARLFRQYDAGKWVEVIDEVVAELKRQYE